MKTHTIQHIEKTLPDEVLLELGRIVASWIELDACLDKVLEKLAEMDRYMDGQRAPVHVQDPFSQRLQAFGTYCSQLTLEFPHLRNCRHVHERLKTVHQLRNHYLEGGNAPGMGHGEGEPCSGRAAEGFEAEDLRRVSQEINRAHEALYALVFRPGTRLARC
jgi:hypothetical protein